MDIVYKHDAPLDVDEVIALYKRSTLGERRPVDRPDIFKKMISCAGLTITAWDEDRLIGIARSFTDFGYVAYLADLAVDGEYQKQGIGKRLIDETRAKLDATCQIVLLAAPAANGYYPRLGFENNPRAWVLRGVDK
jgi:predicted N-acetyltransferase YhbS